ncbi:MAG: ImmA/IrrE family metallo-endopeptidase [Nanoarchaeota archaeon]
MEENRKKSIDNLVNELKSKYDVKSLEGLRQLSKDKGISVIESDETIIPQAISFNDGRRYILLRETSLNKDFILGHELGHQVLHHVNNKKLKINDEEKEANYFAEQLLNKRDSYSCAFVNVLFTIAENPILSFMCVFFPYFDRKNYLNIIKNYENK